MQLNLKRFICISPILSHIAHVKNAAAVSKGIDIHGKHNNSGCC